MCSKESVGSIFHSVVKAVLIAVDRLRFVKDGGSFLLRLMSRRSPDRIGISGLVLMGREFARKLCL